MKTRIASRLALLAAALVIAGCAAVTKVNSGETLVRNRLSVVVDTPWNQFERGMAGDNVPTWTVEGITVDALQFYVGIKDGEEIATTPSGAKTQPLRFHSTMQPADVVALYQSLSTRDGSSFTLDKLEPADFAGSRGFRFEYTLVRKSDDVRLRGIAYGAVRNGELFLIKYSAPRLAFFPKYVGRVEALVKTAKVKG